MSGSCAVLSKRQVRRAFSRWPAASELYAEPARRLWARVGAMAQNPALAVDIGGDGVFLAACYPQARVLAVDMALPALAGGRQWRLCADAEQLPLADGRAQLLWSNLCVEWSECRVLFGEAARVLSRDGLLAFTTLGPDTLREARAVFGDEARIHEFTDMHDLGDQLLAAGFTEPVMECERLTLTYSGAAAALSEPRRCGGGNAGRQRRAMTKTRWRQAIDDYQRRFSDASGRVYATYEVIYATAWRGTPAAAGGESPLRFWRRP